MRNSLKLSKRDRHVTQTLRVYAV